MPFARHADAACTRARGATRAGAEQGFFDLTQAKKAMGLTALSAHKYDSRMSALAVVEAAGDDAAAPVRWTLARTPPGTTTAHAASTATDVSAPSTGRATKSAAAAAAAAAGPASGNAASAEAAGSGPAAPVDPLRWFGVLVPPHLRKAQERFVQTLPVLVALANEQASLEALHARYNAARQPAGPADRAR